MSAYELVDAIRGLCCKIRAVQGGGRGGDFSPLKHMNWSQRLNSWAPLEGLPTRVMSRMQYDSIRRELAAYQANGQPIIDNVELANLDKIYTAYEVDPVRFPETVPKKFRRLLDDQDLTYASLKDFQAFEIFSRNSIYLQFVAGKHEEAVENLQTIHAAVLAEPDFMGGNKWHIDTLLAQGAYMSWRLGKQAWERFYLNQMKRVCADRKSVFLEQRLLCHQTFNARSMSVSSKISSVLERRNDTPKCLSDHWSGSLLACASREQLSKGLDLSDRCSDFFGWSVKDMWDRAIEAASITSDNSEGVLRFRVAIVEAHANAGRLEQALEEAHYIRRDATLANKDNPHVHIRLLWAEALAYLLLVERGSALLRYPASDKQQQAKAMMTEVGMSEAPGSEQKRVESLMSQFF